MRIFNELYADMGNRIIFSGSLLAALAVIAGAFGAHALKEILNTSYMKTYETAVTYHFFHAFAIMLCGLLINGSNSARIRLAFRLFFAGICLFSGSLYVLSLMVSLGYTSFSRIGMITPLGGLCFISGWLMVVMASRK